MTIEKRKRADGSIEIVKDGKITDIIRKDGHGYSKAIVTSTGEEFTPPMFSHFATLKAALRFCGL